MALRVVTSHLHSDVMLSSSSPTTLLTSSMTFPAQIRQRRASKALSGFNLLGFGTGSVRRRDLGVVVVASSNAAASEPWEAFTPDKASGAPSLSDVFWPSAGAFVAMAVLGKVDQLLAPKGISMTIAPLGAVCAVLFTSPASPAARDSSHDFKYKLVTGNRNANTIKSSYMSSNLHSWVQPEILPEAIHPAQNPFKHKRLREEKELLRLFSDSPVSFTVTHSTRHYVDHTSKRGRLFHTGPLHTDKQLPKTSLSLWPSTSATECQTELREAEAPDAKRRHREDRLTMLDSSCLFSCLGNDVDISLHL
ncbi:hypothetical protein QQ045_017828 [Rhodiola kirilowii]